MRMEQSHDEYFIADSDLFFRNNFRSDKSLSGEEIVIESIEWLKRQNGNIHGFIRMKVPILDVRLNPSRVTRFAIDAQQDFI